MTRFCSVIKTREGRIVGDCMEEATRYCRLCRSFKCSIHDCHPGISHVIAAGNYGLCPDCDGTGETADVSGKFRGACPRCGGQGYLPLVI